MSLQTRLDLIRDSFEKEAPPGVLVVMHRATDDLRASGIMGRPTALAAAISVGPVVLTYYRGDW